MSLYERPVRSLMRDMTAALGVQPRQIIDRKQIQAWFSEHYPKVKEGTITAHLSLMSTNAPGRIHHNPKPSGEADFFFQLDAAHFRLYEPLSDPTPIYREAFSPTNGVEESEEESSGGASSPLDATGRTSEFAYERDLRSFLAKNLTLVEPGLRLYEEEGIAGIEFPAGGRFIDILALDSRNDYVVIELKVSKGYDKVVGQLLRYMGWIETHHADAGQQVRGIIVAKEITADLVLACSRIAGVQLYEYELSVTLNRVEKNFRESRKTP